MAGAVAAPCRSPRWGYTASVTGTGPRPPAAAGPLTRVELADVRATPENLAPLAQASGGGVFWIGNGTVPEIRRVSAGRAASGHNWMGFLQHGDYVVTGFRELPLL